ncbi:MAG TPA: response regulator [Nitrospiraceae bacterium]|nr:response regulator [Nitrospiraceae bacterium]
MERTKKIIIIDDDERHLIATKELLEEEGYEVITHKNAFGSTNLIREVQPDLVLLDVNMPALSGERLSSLLLSNKITKHVPLVFYSSNDEDSLRRSVSEYGVKGYICKGDIFELKRKVAYYLSPMSE